jgi:hypothetical protein
MEPVTKETHACHLGSTLVQKGTLVLQSETVNTNTNVMQSNHHMYDHKHGLYVTLHATTTTTRHLQPKYLKENTKSKNETELRGYN